MTVVITQDRKKIVLTRVVQPVVVAAATRQAIVAGQQGIQGPIGLSGPPGADGGTYTTKVAAQALGGHRIVRAVSATEVDYASADDVAHGDDVLGMTIGAAASGAVVYVSDDQDITEPSWAWTPLEPLFLGLNGQLTQAPPGESSAAFSLVVGFATSATSVRIRIEPPIYF